MKRINSIPSKIEQTIFHYERSKVIISMILVPVLLGIFALLCTILDGTIGKVAAIVIAYFTVTGIRYFATNIAFDRAREKYYGDDLHNFIIDSGEAQKFYEQPTIEQKKFELTLVNKPEKSMGKFKESLIYEWLDFKSADGKAIRFIFEGVVDDIQSHQVKDGQILLSPGLLYSTTDTEVIINISE